LTNGIQVLPTATSQAVLSTPFIFILLAGLLTVPVLVVFLLGGFRAGGKSVAEPWACGYGYSPQMGVSATNFAQPMRLAFQPLYELRLLFQKPLDDIAGFSRKVNDGLPGKEPLLERAVCQPIMSSVQYVGKRIQQLQMGDIRMYCLYIFIALAVLLGVIFR
jgi:hydrogenase-4 component B